NSQGPLASDGSLRILQSSLLSAVTRGSGGGPFANLASLGIKMNDDGTLTVDAGQLSSALTNDSSGVLNFFQNSSLTGFANLFAKDLHNLTDSIDGVVSVDLAQNQQQQNTLSDSIGVFQDRLSSEQQRLLTQFSQINSLLQSFPFLLQSIDMQLGISSSGSNRNR